ncbi:hypothetical protein [Calidifontibacter indicus]|uniref:hypothetical protein n=1 Tax=Calidifontibacter indicus TaxID=419650 RepID=UPI003D75FAFF
MTALADLVDEFGEAIESDLSRYHGDSLRDFLTGARPPGEALRKIRMLPSGCATHAQMLTAPKRPDAPGEFRSRRPEPWRAHYGWTREHELLADVFDAVLATAGGKKRPKPHPRTGTGGGVKRGRPNAAKPTSR